jgi:hypothetical protein
MKSYSHEDTSLGPRCHGNRHHTGETLYAGKQCRTIRQPAYTNHPEDKRTQVSKKRSVSDHITVNQVRVYLYG